MYSRLIQCADSEWIAILFLLPCLLISQDVKFSSLTRQFIFCQSPVLVLQNARVVDGTGSPAKPEMSVVIRDGKISEIAHSGSVQIPEGAEIIDLEGNSHSLADYVGKRHLVLVFSRAHW